MSLGDAEKINLVFSVLLPIRVQQQCLSMVTDKAELGTIQALSGGFRHLRVCRQDEKFKLFSERIKLLEKEYRFMTWKEEAHIF